MLELKHKPRDRKLSGRQPAGHLQDQAPRREQHGLRVLDPVGQLEPRAEAGRHLEPFIHLRCRARRAIERIQQRRAAAFLEACARQAPDVVHRFASQAVEPFAVGACRRQGR